MKKVAILLSLIVFCFAQNNTSTKTNIAGKWNLSALKGTYDRKVVTGSGIEHSADKYDLVASWDDAAGFAAVTGNDAAFITGATNQTLESFTAGDNAPGFPLTSTFDAAGLAALGIVMKGVFDDAPNNDKTGTYKITGTYPSIRLNTETCTPYLTVPQINDQGDYTLTYDATDAAGTIAFSPELSLPQVLPPFPDGKFTIDGGAGKLTIDFLDRDSHSSRYSEVMAAWSEADDRVISGRSQLPVNTAGGFFTTAEDPDAGDLASSAYIYHIALASWGGYLTWYAFNVIAETSLKAADTLTDLDGDGIITPADMVVYMHMDNLAAAGSISHFGIPYALLVDSSNPAAPAPVNDSATDFTLQGLATASGGKMKYTIESGLCMPVDETINIAFEFSIINSEPEISTTQDLTINEDESSTVTLSATDADGDAITYSAVSDTNAVTISVSTSTLTLTPNANWHGVANIKAYASDGYSKDSTSFKLTVNPVSDIAAVQDVTIDEDKSAEVTLTSTFTGTTTFTAVSDTNAVTTSVSSSTLTLTPNANWHGVANIKAYASDGTSKDSTTFKLTVTPVQDAPTAFEWVSSALDTINITQSNLDDIYTLQWGASTDAADGDSINYLVYAKIGVYPAEEVFDTTSTSAPITYQELVENVFEPFPMLPRVTVKITVVATDGIDTVKVTGDDRVLFVNRYDYLSTEGEGVPVEFALHENYPNPFNPTTTLRFDLPEVSDITLTIYNMLGQKVRTFNMQSTSAGYHSVTWDATNDFGEQVGAGVYLYQLQTKDFVKTRKMVLLK
jgi:hypothetical protein